MHSKTEKLAKPLFRADGTPYYVQLSAIIRKQIANGSLKIDDKLPTLKQLVVTYGVSPMTVRQAIAGLVKEGLLSATRGRGTFVTAIPNSLSSVPFELNRFSIKAETALSFRVMALRPAQGELEISQDDGEAFGKYQYMKREFTSNGSPYIIAEYLIADEIYQQIPEKAWTEELISTVLYDHKAAGLNHVHQKFRVISSMPQEAAELNIQTHEPVIQVSRTFLNEAKQVLCLAQLVYRTDGVIFDMHVDVNDRKQLLELGGFPIS